MTRLARLAVLGSLTCALLCAFAGTALASKQVIAYFGTKDNTGSLGGEFRNPNDIAVNSTGAGPAGRGDIYVVESFLESARIQRFEQDDNGTSGDPYDDTYNFIGAWGADVNATTTGSADYEICTVAADCQFGVGSGGNGTVGGDGSLSGPIGVAVDQETGEVYVADSENFRVNVYEGDGTFLRSFGYDVVQSGPENTGTGYEVCVAANGDVCKAGLSGNAAGQIGNMNGIAVSSPDGDPATGKVFISDSENHRVDTYALDGSSPGGFGAGSDFGSVGPFEIAVDSRGIVYTGAVVTGGLIRSIVTRYDTQNVNGVGVGPLAPIDIPALAENPVGTNNGLAGLEVDPDSDGAGPDQDVLYVLRNLGPQPYTVIQQFGPLNAPGLTSPPTSSDEQHGETIGFNFVNNLGFDAGSGKLFVSAATNVGGPNNGESGPGRKSGVYVLDNAGGAPSASLDSVSEITDSTATVNATIDPNGPPPVSYHLEYSSDGSTWASTPEVTVGSQETPQMVEARLDPPGIGLQSNTFYHVRMVVTKVFTPPIVTPEATFTTLPAPPDVETVGSPVRTATTARLQGRVNPRGTAATYHFEYGTEGACDAHPCQSSEPLEAGSGNFIELVAQPVDGLQPGTTYYYRLVADNGEAGSPAFGKGMTVTTRSSNSPLTHGHFPGPPGSDRAWEQVNVADTGGNPVLGGIPFSDDGERAIYQIGGGTPISDSGSGFNEFFAERTASGWKSVQILPKRGESTGANWLAPAATSDLSQLVAINADTASGRTAVFRLRPDGPPTKLVETPSGGFFLAITSADASRVVAMLENGAEGAGFYDISDGSPHLVSLLPGEVPGSCVTDPLNGRKTVRRTTHWLSEDGRLFFFYSKDPGCSGTSQLYSRDLIDGRSARISPPPLSGAACEPVFLKSTPDAAFFWSQARLSADDTAPATCNSDKSDGDVYRYDLTDASLSCLTCLVPGLDADVVGQKLGAAFEDIAVAEDGSRVYFRSPNRLLPGASVPGLYRLDVANDDLAYVAPVGASDATGDFVRNGNAITPDGSVFIFRSADPRLDERNGEQNGATSQYYRYDDRDRSLICVSCPQNGSAPAQPAGTVLAQRSFAEEIGPNSDPLDDHGDFLFSTPNALVSSDQNTASAGANPVGGTDLYEWRDGRILLVSDGLTRWPDESVAPAPMGISPSGRDAFFVAAAAYTPDAPDAYSRLYDARIGGGIEFPQPPKPCPLEVCQGIPKGAPDEAIPATSFLVGSGGVATKKDKVRKRKHKRHRPKRRHAHGSPKNANASRRSAR